jgi:hypothetical protein
VIALFATLGRHLRTAGGRRLVAHRTLVALLTLALLLIPSTCAEAAGPHSIYRDPTAGTDHANHAGHAGNEPAGSMTQRQLEWHVLLGETGPGAAATEERATGTPVEYPAGPDGSRFTDLPSTMAIASATAPAVLIDEVRIELPTAGEPAGLEPLPPNLTIISPESPPPRH